MAGERVAVLADPVVRLDLRGVFVPGRAPATRRNSRLTAGQSTLGQRGHVRVVVADRAVPLGEDLHACRNAPARAQSRATTLANSLPSVVGLAVWPCVRDSIGSAACSCAKPRSFSMTFSSSADSTRARRAQHARVGEVVDVLGGAAEVHQLEHRGRGAARGELLAHEVLDRLHVVVDARFDGLDGGRRVLARLERQARGELAHGIGQRLLQASAARIRPGDSSQAASMRIRSRISPLSDSTARSAIGSLAVAAIDGRKRGKCCGIHERDMPRNFGC